MENQAKHASIEKQARKYFKPWALDSSEIFRSAKSINDFRQLNQLIIKPDGLDDFLQERIPSKLVLAGSRGVGKTLALTMKAAFLSEQSDVTLLRQHYPFVHQLSSASAPIELRFLNLYANHSYWVAIWKLVLGTLMAICILRNEKQLKQNASEEDVIHDMVTRLFKCPEKDEVPYKLFITLAQISKGHSDPFRQSISDLLKSRVTGLICSTWYQNYVLYVLGMGSPVRKYMAFVDGIDECLGDPDGKKLFDRVNETSVEQIDHSEQDYKNIRAQAGQVWLSAQTGFMEAVYNLRSESGERVHVYGTVRAEAFECFPSVSSISKSKALSALALELKYTVANLRSIFDLNVQSTSPDDLADTALSGSYSQRLYGIKESRHSRVWGNPEDVLQALIRHTFQAPRELICLAKAAKDAVMPPTDRPKNIPIMIAAVDRAAATTIFEDYKRDVFPLWDSRYEEGFQFITSNTLDQTQVDSIESQFSELSGCNGLFDFLYARGLVGVPHKTTGSGTVIFNFIKPTGVEVQIPKPINYIALHSCLSAKIYRNITLEKQSAFYNGTMIVGPGLSAPERLVPTKLLLRQAGKGKSIELLVNQDIVKGNTEHHYSMEFLYGLILSIRRHEVPKVNPKQICGEIEHLESCGFVEQGVNTQILNRLLSENYTHSYSEPSFVKEAKKIVKNYNLCLRFNSGAPNMHGLAWCSGDRQHRDCRSVAADEIEVRIP